MNLRLWKRRRKKISEDVDPRVIVFRVKTPGEYTRIYEYKNGLNVYGIIDGRGEFVRHRTDGPAYDDPVHDYYVWFFHGKRHRTDGPAEYGSRFGVSKYWVKGREMTREEFLQHFDEKT